MTHSFVTLKAGTDFGLNSKYTSHVMQVIETQAVDLFCTASV